MRLSEYASTQRTYGSRKVPRSVQQSIPIDQIYEDGTWRCGNVYSQMWSIRTAVPDRFAAAVMTVYMGCCCFGAVNAIRNILAIWAYYKGLDFQYLYADGITGYELKFTTFQVGIGIYSVQIIVCVAFAAVLLLSHIRYKKLQKGGA